MENPKDGGSWQATVHKVTQSWTGLKRLSTHAAQGKINDKQTNIKIYQAKLRATKKNKAEARKERQHEVYIWFICYFTCNFIYGLGGGSNFLIL